MEEKKTGISICLLITLTFLWTGCGYLSWFYHLTAFYDTATVDMLTEVIGYVFQSAGILVYVLYSRKSTGQTAGRGGRRQGFSLLSFAGLALCLLASMSPAAGISLIFGYAMNIVFGMIAACYLSILAGYSDRNRTGILFGIGYGTGSILSYLISLMGDGNFLADPRAFAVYFAIWAASVPLSVIVIPESGTGQQALPADAGIKPAIAARALNYLWIPGITVLLLSCVKSGGFYFPAADLGDHNVSLELSRSFYAAGLIAAGLINDKKRPAGAVLCAAALAFPFFTIIAGEHIGISYLLWISGYIFFGFYAVYRVLLFIDISHSDGSLLWLAPAGLMWGRLGDAAGAACGITLNSKPMMLITVMAALFAVCIFLFFYLYQLMYMQPAKAEPDHVLRFAARCSLSQRETELLRLILDGCTNKEIAEKLFISENTVKFHMRNLLHKTGCARRTELLVLFDSFMSMS